MLTSISTTEHLNANGNTMKEFVLKGEYSLTKTLRAINQAFIVLNRYSDADKKMFLRAFVKVAKKDPAQAWKEVLRLTEKFPDDHLDVVNPMILFETYGLPAYIGEKDHGLLFCKNMIIGLKLSLGGTANISYRLDFDGDENKKDCKLLHLNFEIYDGTEQFPICAKFFFSTGRFGFSLKDKVTGDQDNLIKKSLLELT